MDFCIPRKENAQIMNAPENIDEQQSDDELSNHSRRFGGIKRLYGQTTFENFCHAHICVVGIGGVGSVMTVTASFGPAAVSHVLK